METLLHLCLEKKQNDCMHAQGPMRTEGGHHYVCFCYEYMCTHI